jgi:hypothetical protein
MQIARAMAVKIVFNSTWIACVDLRTVMYDRVVVSTVHVNARRVRWGSDLISLRCHCGKNLRSDDSRRPRGICLVGPSLVYTSSRWTTCQVLELTEIRSWNFWKNSSLSESTGSSKYIGVGIGRARQILVLLNVEQVGGEIEERSQKISENPPRQPSCKPQ